MSYIKAPDKNAQHLYDYLEGLRQSGVVNMFGAVPFLQSFIEEGGHDYEDGHKMATRILADWMKGHNDKARTLPAPNKRS